MKEMRIVNLKNGNIIHIASINEDSVMITNTESKMNAIKIQDSLISEPSKLATCKNKFLCE